jgi:hypothetical protein
MKNPKLLKRILAGLGIFLAVVLILIVGVFVFLDSIIKNAIEKGAPAFLGCKATVEKISVKPFSGRVLVKNLKLASPAGYAEPEMFAIGEFRLKVDVGSVLKKNGPVVINEIIIHEPLIAYEVVGSKSNFQHLMDRLPKSDAPEKPKDEKKPGRKVIIDRVEFRDGQVNVRAGYTLGYGIPLPLPGLKLTDIGRAGGGVTAAQAVGSILGSLASSVTELVTSSAKFITDQAKNLAEGAAEIGGKAIDAAADAGKAAAGAVKDAAGAVKGLFKK